MQGQNFINFLKNIVFLQLFLIVIIAGVGIDFAGINRAGLEQADKLSLRLSPIAIGISPKTAINLFALNSVALAGQNAKADRWLVEFRREMPETLMVANLQLPASRGQRVNIPESNKSLADINLPFDQDEDKQEIKYYQALEDYQVVVYCTHSAETYIPDSGKARCDGERGLINNVAGVISTQLQSAGMKADFIDSIHDYPDYDKSYTNSRETVKKILDSKEKLLALFDVHRDSIPGKESADTINVRGKKAARILIIVGTDERKEHPHWKSNLAFAESLYQQGEQMYPGLIKGVRTKSGTYNQEFFDHSLLLEVGSDYNSFAEAKYAGELFAQILLEVLEEETLK
ncbi:MAG: stage II sporulation protein P [Syntrophomonadaceae bacterium]|nr:stage II sporulation protein P [Syntrophomonadaceae bacterium]